MGIAVATIAGLAPTAGFAAAARARTEADVSGLTVRAAVSSAGFGASDPEPKVPVSMSVTNHTGRDLRNVEARQALDGDLSGAVITGSPAVSHGSVEYDSRGLMWQGDLIRNQAADVSYVLTAPAGSDAQQALRELRPGSRLETTITSTSS